MLFLIPTITLEPVRRVPRDGGHDRHLIACSAEKFRFGASGGRAVASSNLTLVATPTISAAHHGTVTHLDVGMMRSSSPCDDVCDELLLADHGDLDAYFPSIF